jgi:hypothetical protein
VVIPVLGASDSILEMKQRREQIGALPGSVHLSGEDADDRIALVVQRQVLADHVGTAAEAAGPKPFAQHHHPLGPRLVLLRPESASQDRPHPQSLKDSRRDVSAVDPFRLTVARQSEIRAVEGDEAFERLALLLHVLEVRHREAHVGDLLRPFGQEHQAIGLLVGERVQEDPIDHAEDGRVGPYSEGQRQHRHRAESRIAGEQTYPIARVLPERPHQTRLLPNRGRTVSLSGQSGCQHAVE